MCSSAMEHEFNSMQRGEDKGVTGRKGCKSQQGTQAEQLKEPGFYLSLETSLQLAPNSQKTDASVPCTVLVPLQAGTQPVPEGLGKWKIPERCASSSASFKAKVTRKVLHTNEPQVHLCCPEVTGQNLSGSRQLKMDKENA